MQGCRICSSIYSLDNMSNSSAAFMVPPLSLSPLSPSVYLVPSHPQTLLVCQSLFQLSASWFPQLCSSLLDYIICLNAFGFKHALSTVPLVIVSKTSKLITHLSVKHVCVSVLSLSQQRCLALIRAVRALRCGPRCFQFIAMLKKPV